MRNLGTLEEEAYLDDLIENRGDEAPVVEIRIGDKVYASSTGPNRDPNSQDRFEEGEWGAQEGDSPALDVDIQLAGRIPFEYQNAPIIVSVVFGGIRIIELVGVMSRPRYDQSQSGGTKIEAYSAGSYLDKVVLGSFTEYSGVAPQTALLDALYRIQPYDRSEINVFNFDVPLFTRIGQDGFHEEDHPASVYAAVLESTDGVGIDSARGGIKVIRNPHVGVGSPVVWRYDADDLLEWTFPSVSGADELYTSVVVASEDTGQIATSRIYREAKVDWTGVRYPPVAGQKLYIPFTDASPNADTHALDMAMRVARQLSAGTYKSEIVAPYNPKLEKYDVISISEMFWDDAGAWHREWLAVIDGYCRTRGRKGAGLETAFSCSLTLTSAERVPSFGDVLEGVAQAKRAQGITRAVIKPGIGVRPNVGLKVGGIPS